MTVFELAELLQKEIRDGNGHQRVVVPTKFIHRHLLREDVSMREVMVMGLVRRAEDVYQKGRPEYCLVIR